MDYTNRLYNNYVSTHILHRKGKPTLDEFKNRAITYQKQFGKVLPENKDSKIIDAGCGNGSIVWWLQQNGFTNVNGADISSEQIGIAKELGIKNVIQADLRECLKDKRNSYDVIFLRDTLEHFEKKEILGVLDICFNALREGGAIIIQVPNAESPFGARMRYGDFTHEIAFTSGSLSQVLRTVGFNKITLYAWGSLPALRLKSIVRCALWKMVEAFYKLILIAEGCRNAIVTQNIIAVAKK